MFAGCMSFMIIALVMFGFCVAPWFLFSANSLMQLAKSVGASIPFVLVVGVVLPRYSIPASFGFLGGILAAGVFMFLRIDQMFSLAQANQTNPPDYPHAFQFLVPTAVFSLALLLVVISWPKNR